jgi:hypothetical protein
MKTTSPLIRTLTGQPFLRSDFILVVFALAGFALCPTMEAVVPPPDGGYPNFNTAEGQHALFSLTTGVANTAVGWFSLNSNTDGSFNTGVGAGTLLFNIGDQSTGEGTQNTALGADALLFNTAGQLNTAVGVAALLNNSEGDLNTAVGVSALSSNSDGSRNNAFGFDALASNTSGVRNTAIGNEALAHNITGGDNTAIGFQALFGHTGGNGNIGIGSFAGIGIGDASNVICIGAPGLIESNRCFIGNIFNTTLTGGNAVFINASGKLGLITSSHRFKEEVKPMKRASEDLFALKPVTFRYKKEIDSQGIPQFGLIAEEVDKVNPDLVVRDQEGKPYSVRYDQVNAMLLNEFLKEHHKMQQLEATVAQQRSDFETTITELKKEMKRVAARFEEQDARIQRMSAQIELNGTARQKVVSN